MTDNVFKVFTSAQLTNAEYHDPKGWAAEYVSGSSLGDIHASCPAAWKFKQRDENSKPLIFGTQSHTNFESKQLFEKTYRRAPAPEDYKDLITSQMALASKLKSFGLKGTSGKGYPELLEMLHRCGEDLNVWWLIELLAEWEAKHDGVELVPAKDYDACVRMRQVLEAIPEHNACMNSPTAQRELSIFGVINGVKVKVRLDHVDECENVKATIVSGMDEKGDPILEEVVYPEAIVITDYKSTQSANPLEFGRSCVNHGYLLKMALQHDLFKKAYPEETRPVVVRLLAQEKKEPFLPLAFRMNPVHLKIGRMQYMSVINTYAMCEKHDIWPSYANGEPEVNLEVPEWFMKQYKGFI